MHMANSVVPLDLLGKVEQVSGVDKVEPVAFFSGKVNVGKKEVIGYIAGIGSTAEMGGPWRMAAGSPSPEPGEAVIPKSLAESQKLRIGDRVQVLEKWFKISGLSLETEGIATNFIVMNIKDAHSLHSQQGAANYLLVRAKEGNSSLELTRRIEEQVPQISVFSRQVFAENDRQIAIQMGMDIIKAMSVAAMVIGLMVIMLTIYTATVEKSREYGILKAIGAGNFQLFGVVLIQSLVSTLTGFLVGTAVTWGVSKLVAVLTPKVYILLEPAPVGQTFLLILGMALVASLLPTWRIARTDPMVVFSKS